MCAIILYYRPDARVNLRIGLENADESESSHEETLALESLVLATRLDRLLGPSLGIGEVDKANNEEEDRNGDRLAVHALIIPAFGRPVHC